MAVVTAQHHSAQLCCTIATQTVDSPSATYAATVASPMAEYVDPAPVVPAPVFDYVAPASAVTFAAPAPVIEYVAPAPVFEYIPPAPAVSLSVSSQQLRTGVNLDVTGLVYPQFPGTAVESSASQVVGSLPPCEVFAAPVFDQAHQEQLAGGEIPENLVEIPVIPEQVIVQAISRVAHSLPPDEEFHQPVYSPVHQEQFPAGETTENFVKIPVVQEQVFIRDIPEVVVPLPPAQEFSAPVYGHVHQVFAGMRPERLVDARGPQRCVRTVPSVTSLPPLPDLCRGDVHDATPQCSPCCCLQWSTSPVMQAVQFPRWFAVFGDTQPVVGNNRCLELDSVVLARRCTTPGAVCVRARCSVARGDTIGRPDMRSTIASLSVVLVRYEICWLLFCSRFSILSFTVLLLLFVAVWSVL